MHHTIQSAAQIHAQPGSILGYTVQARIGRSASAELYSAFDTDGQRIAIKHVRFRDARATRLVAQLQNELEFSRVISHPGVRRVHSLEMELNAQGKLAEAALVMEFIDGAPIRRLPEMSIGQSLAWFGQVAYALAAMHRCRFIHCDIKPGNILVTRDDRIKLIDLGQSCPIGCRKAHASGTRDFMAPEQTRRMPLSPRTDIYGFGATLYWLLTGELVPAIAPEEALPMSSRAMPPMEIDPRISRPVSDLVMACIQPDERLRPESFAKIAPRIERMGMTSWQNQPALAAAG
jgi:eukaryotic-like serine/threonine-protein kinase